MSDVTHFLTPTPNDGKCMNCGKTMYQHGPMANCQPPAAETLLLGVATRPNWCVACNDYPFFCEHP